MYGSALKYFLLPFVFLLTVVVPAFAAPPKGSLEGSPAFTEVVLEQPDEIKQIVLTYTNHSQAPLTLELFPIDFKQADGTGAISFLGQEAGSFSYSLSSFLSFEAREVQLDAGQKRDFIISVKNREDLSPGGHYAAVIAKVKIPEGEGAGEAKVAPSISSFILLRKVGGERFNLSLTDLNWPQNGIVFSYPRSTTATFQNEGNVHLVPYGRAEVKDIFGRLVYKGVINTSSLRVFPETRRYIPIEMQKITWNMPISINTVTVEGNDSLSKVIFAYKGTFLYINPMFGAVLVVGAVAAAVLRRRKGKK